MKSIDAGRSAFDALMPTVASEERRRQEDAEPDKKEEFFLHGDNPNKAALAFLAAKRSEGFVGYTRMQGAKGFAVVYWKPD